MRTRWGRVVAAVAAATITWGAAGVAGATEPGTVVAGNSSAAPNHYSGGIIGGDHDSSSFSFTADPLADQPTFCLTQYAGGWNLISPDGDHVWGTLSGHGTPLTVRAGPGGPACGALVVHRESLTLSLTVTGGTGAWAGASGTGQLTGTRSYGIFDGELVLSVD